MATGALRVAPRWPVEWARAPLLRTRRSVRDRVERTLVDTRSRAHQDRHLAAFAAPPGDPGLFGPASITWQVHSDLPSMLVGGVAALLLQTLHPLAMAGVAEHSAYRADPLGRLRRTATFVGTTTFGSTEAALKAIASVRAVHRRVRGVAPDGRPYDATDPALVTWVHAAETWSFLRAYQRYGPRPLGRGAADRYLTEMAVIARHLGAVDVPESTADLRRYFAVVRPELEAGALALSGAAFILHGGGRSLPAPAPAELAARVVLTQAAVDLLPGWARSMLRLRQPLLAERLAVRVAADSAFVALRWSLGPSPALQAARQRCGQPADPEEPTADGAGPPESQRSGRRSSGSAPGVGAARWSRPSA